MAENTEEKTENASEDAVSQEQREGAEGEAAQARIGELESARQALEEENLSLKNQCLLIQADADNFRKRLLREKQESIQAANKQLLTDLLPVLDDFSRAIKSGEVSQDFAAFRSGIAMIEKQLSDLLDRRWGLKRFDSLGQEFDPRRHEALSCEERPGLEASTVLEDYLTGYMLHDKILRAAKVKISMPAQPAGAGDDANKNADAPENPGNAG
ncbi:MAG: nucleotide exchange factor GrpE [Spirochaetia bacterium]|nr:nucleotide exchange factor GrpE [Spirochaetia bacterium]